MLKFKKSGKYNKINSTTTGLENVIGRNLLLFKRYENDILEVIISLFIKLYLVKGSSLVN